MLSLFNFCERTGIKFFGAIRLLKLVILERFSIAFTANGKRQAEISRLPKKFIWFQFIFCLLATPMEQVLKTEKYKPE